MEEKNTQNKSKNGTVISASRMTDMPKFYPKELIEEVEKRRSKGVLIHTLVLWTKHPKSLLAVPLNSYLKELRDDGIQLYLQLTITGMGQQPMGVDSNGNPVVMEPRAPRWEESIYILPEIINLVGNPLRIRLRIDPILRFKDAAGTVYSNLGYMPKIIAATAPLGIKTYCFSFVEDGMHDKVNRRFAKLGATILPPNDEEREKTKEWLGKLCNQYGINIYSCSVPGFPRSSCIDGALLEQLHDTHMPTSHKPQLHRPLCGCTDSIDIGGWPPKKCFTGCQYCYASSSY